MVMGSNMWFLMVLTSVEADTMGSLRAIMFQSLSFQAEQNRQRDSVVISCCKCYVYVLNFWKKSFKMATVLLYIFEYFFKFQKNKMKSIICVMSWCCFVFSVFPKVSHLRIYIIIYYNTQKWPDKIEILNCRIYPSAMTHCH